MQKSGKLESRLPSIEGVHARQDRSLLEFSHRPDFLNGSVRVWFIVSDDPFRIYIGPIEAASHR